MPDGKKRSDHWTKSTIPLAPGHKWQCKAGNELFIADRGAVAFEFPKGWVVRHNQTDTITLHDVAPPDDQARLSLTIFHLPPIAGGWGQLPLDQLMLQSQELSESKGEVVVRRVSRADLELAWADKPPYSDPENGRRIRCRQILSRARGIQALITFEIYEDAAEKFSVAWDNLLETLRLGVPRDITGDTGN